MNLSLTNLRKNISLIKPINTNNKDINALIAQLKFVISENHNKNIILDFAEINFLDCIKISAIIGTYHFLELTQKKIFIIVKDIESKKTIETLCFDNLEVVCNKNKLALESIA